MPLSQHEIEYIRKALGREPTRAEWLVFEAEWSEHCSYKSSKRWLRILPSEGPHVVIGPGLDAPLIKVKGVYISFKIESHNHPSAVDPYNGAATGVGGIVRDILTTGLRPIALLDNLYFGLPSDRHVLWIVRNVVRGISDYGNRIGVPVVAGETWFDESFSRNPIVLATCVGVGREGQVVVGRAGPGDLILLIGNDTGRDGLLGSSFASKALGEKSEEDIAAIQVGNPLLERLLIDVVAELARRGLVKAIKDVGGGGLATALSELAARFGLGVRAYLDRIRLRDELEPEEILVSESQERMVVVVDPSRLKEVIGVLDEYDVGYDVFAELTDTGKFEAYYKGVKIVDLPISLIVGTPHAERTVERPKWIEDLWGLPDLSGVGFADAFETVLSSPNIASKEPIYSTYDYEVGIRTVIKPGRASAAVLRILEEDGGDGRLGIAIKGDANPRHTFLDPFIGASNSFTNAYRNVIAVGARPIAAVDAINVGNPEKPHVYWYFVEIVKGLAYTAKTLGIPIVGGNVSFYNEDEATGREIKPVVTVVVLGYLDDVSRAIEGGLKGDGYLVVIGETYAELGGSELVWRLLGETRGRPPKPRLEEEVKHANAVLRLAEMGLISACMDVGIGGLAITLAKMALIGGVGLKADLSKTPRVGAEDPLTTAFSESNARYIIETHDVEGVSRVLDEMGIPHAVIGRSGGNEVQFKWGSRVIYKADLERLMMLYKSLKGIP